MHLKYPILLCLALTVLGSCISPQDEAGECTDCSEQQIILQVQESGEASTRAGRPLYSNQHDQMVDHVALFVCYYGNKDDTDKPNNKIVAVKHITDWETESSVYDKGRRYYLNLMGSNRVPEGEATYKIYAIGYTQRPGNTSDYTYGEKKLHEYLTGLKTGSDFPENLTLSLSGTPDEEIFAGTNTETDGLIHCNEEGGFTTEVILHRQVAGVYVYVKDIPQRDQAKELRLTAACDNDGLVLGQFDTEDYGQNERKDNRVVNGTQPQSGIDDSHRATLCSIDLTEWKGDNGAWKNPYDADNQNPAFVENSYFVGSFVIPFAAPTTTDGNTDVRSLQLELCGGNDNAVLKTWPVVLAEDDPQNGSFTRYTWSGSEFTAEMVTETRRSYSLLRNHLYCIGSKNADNSTDDDDPLPLGNANEIILKAVAEWDVIYDMILEPERTPNRN